MARALALRDAGCGVRIPLGGDRWMLITCILIVDDVVLLADTASVLPRRLRRHDLSGPLKTWSPPRSPLLGTGARGGRRVRRGGSTSCCGGPHTIIDVLPRLMAVVAFLLVPFHS